MTQTLTSTPASITERALLVDLSIGMWGAQKHDKRVSQEVADNHNSDVNMGKFSKALLPAHALKKLTKVATAVKASHDARTAQWDRGRQILSCDGYFDYCEQVRMFKSQWEEALNEFETAYPSYIEEAKIKLNGLFRSSDYPDVSEIRNKFKFVVEFSPLTTASDFRVNIGDDELKILQAEYDKQNQVKLEETMKDVYARVADTIKHLVERLTIYRGKNTGKAGSFRETTVENIRDIVNLIPSLNITGDQTLNDFAHEIKQQLCFFSAEELRESEPLRVQTADKAQEIYDRMSAYL